MTGLILSPMTEECSVSWCDRSARARGLCISHYNRQLKGQDLDQPFEERQKRPVDGLCSVEDCDQPYLASGYCAAHWARAKAGKPMNVPVKRHRRGTTEDRFWRYVDKSGDCWLWTGGTQGAYGQIWDGRVNRHRGAHVVSWELANGMFIPKGMQVRHTCDNPPCVRPLHLLIGTALDDGRDRAERGRSARGAGHGMSKLTEAVVLLIRERHRLGHSQRRIAKDYGVSQHTVFAIVNRKTWTHI
jgi:HNH endonuclease